MLSLSGCAPRDESSDEPFLVCVGGGTLPPAPKPSEPHSVAWLVDSKNLSENDRAWLSRSQKVLELPAAVQTQLQNPIGWWNQHLGIQLEAERRGDHIPHLWEALFRRARGMGDNYQNNGLKGSLARYLDYRTVHQDCNILDRVESIASELGRKAPDRESPKVNCLVCTKRPHLLAQVLQNFQRQKYEAKELVLVLHGDAFPPLSERLFEDNIQVVEVPSKYTFGEALRFGTEKCAGDYILKMDDDDYYGPGLIEDLVATGTMSDAAVIGKASLLFHLATSDRYYQLNPELEFVYRNRGLPGSALFMRREIFRYVDWQPVWKAVDSRLCRDCFQSGLPLLSGSKYHMFASRSEEGHTWSVTHDYFKRYGKQIPAAQASSLFLL